MWHTPGTYDPHPHHPLLTTLMLSNAASLQPTPLLLPAYLPHRSTARTRVPNAAFVHMPSFVVVALPPTYVFLTPLPTLTVAAS